MSESKEWHELYRSAPAIARRKATIPGRLKALGLGGQHRQLEVLDLCCGEGETLQALSEMGFDRLSGVDLEISPELSRDTRFRCVKGDATRTPFADSSFDWIICLHSLHHLTTPERIGELIDEAQRLLRPGGRLAIVDFHDSILSRIALLLLRIRLWGFSNYLNYLSRLVRDEWPYLSQYFKYWKPTSQLLFKPSRFEVASLKHGWFYFYLTLKKPEAERVQDPGHRVSRMAR